MKTSTIIKRSISFGALLFFGFILGYSFAGNCLKMPTLEGARKEAADKAIQQVRKTMEAKEKSYQQKIDSLNAHEEKLSDQLLDIKARMKAAASKAQHLQQKVLLLAVEKKNTGIKSIKSRESIQSMDNADGTTDQLRAGLIELAAAQQQKDTLCSEAISNLETQVSNRDTLINQQQNRYLEIKASLDKSLTQQEGLALENKQYRKQMKKEKRKRTVRTVGTLVVTAISAGLLLTK